MGLNLESFSLSTAPATSEMPTTTNRKANIFFISRQINSNYNCAPRIATTATINEKIMIATVTQYDYEVVQKAINEIIGYAAIGNTHEMIKAMKLFIPEYRSNNSEFEEIDHEIEKKD